MGTVQSSGPLDPLGPLPMCKNRPCDKPTVTDPPPAVTEPPPAVTEPPPALIYTRVFSESPPVEIYTRERLEEIRELQKIENLKQKDRIIDKHVNAFADMLLFTNQNHLETTYSKHYEREDQEIVEKIVQKLQTMFVDAVFMVDKSVKHAPMIVATW